MAQCVLLVDDDRLVTEGLSRNLRGEEFEVVTASSAKEALEIFKTRTVDVVVSDEMMPDITGHELLATVRKLWPETARMILTGHATVEVAMKAINEGEVYRFLTKPVKPQDLAKEIRGALSLKQKQSERRKKLSRRKMFEEVDPAKPIKYRTLAEKPQPPAKKKKLVLVADDDMRSRVRARAELEATGWQVEEVSDGLEAYDWIQSGKLSAVVMELALAGCHGLELLRRMVAKGNTLPVVVTSSYPELAREFAVITYPSLIYLVKPTMRGLLPTSIAELVYERECEAGQAAVAQAEGMPTK